MNVDLQQRSVEFSQLFKVAKKMRIELLEKMPQMQISRVSNHNNESAEDNFNDLIENDLEENELNNIGAPTNDSVRPIRLMLQFVLLITYAIIFLFIYEICY